MYSLEGLLELALSIVFLSFALVVFVIAILKAKESATHNRRSASWFFCALGSLFLVFLAMACAIRTVYYFYALFIWGIIEFVSVIVLRICLPGIIKGRQEQRQEIEREKARLAFEEKQRAEQQRLDSARSDPDFVAAANRIAAIYRSLKGIEWIRDIEIIAAPYDYEHADATTSKEFKNYTSEYMIGHTIYIVCWFSEDDTEWGMAWPEFKAWFDEIGHRETCSELFDIWLKRWLEAFHSADEGNSISSTGLDPEILGVCILKYDGYYRLLYPCSIHGLPKNLLMSEAKALTNANSNG